MSGIGLGLKAASIAAKLSGARSALAKVPPKVWYALAAITLLVGGYLYHQHAVHKALNAAYQSGVAAEAAHVEKQAIAIKAKADTLNARIASAIRSRNDEENGRIHADAGNLRLLGSGKAACPGNPGFSAAAGQSRPAGRPGDAAVAPLPDAAGIDLIGLPFNDTVSFGEDHDLDRAEVLSWREWYQKLIAAWPKSSPKR
jgi:hypothetical protein